MKPEAQKLFLASPSFLSFAARGVLHDIVREYNSRVFQGPPGPPGPAGPPGNSQLFGSHANVTDLVEYIKSKEGFADKLLLLKRRRMK